MFNKKPKLLLRLTRVDKFDCNHTVTTFQYGAHPARVYAFCPFCEKYAQLDWKDTSARLFNRMWGTIPLIIQGTMIIAVLLLTVYAIVVLGKIG